MRGREGRSSQAGSPRHMLIRSKAVANPMMERFLNDRSDWLQYWTSCGGDNQKQGKDAALADK